MPTKINITITMKKVLLLTSTFIMVALLHAVNHTIVVRTSTSGKDTGNTEVKIDKEGMNDTICITANTSSPVFRITITDYNHNILSTHILPNIEGAWTNIESYDTPFENILEIRDANRLIYSSK